MFWLQAEREKDAEEKKEKKLEKLRRIATGENKSKHDFSDPVYDKVGEKALGHFVVKYFGAVLRSPCFHFYYNLLLL